MNDYTSQWTYTISRVGVYGSLNDRDSKCSGSIIRVSVRISLRHLIIPKYMKRHVTYSADYYTVSEISRY